MTKKSSPRTSKPTASALDDAAVRAAAIALHKQVERESYAPGKFLEVPKILTPDHGLWWVGSRRTSPKAINVYVSLFDTGTTSTTNGGQRYRSVFDKED